MAKWDEQSFLWTRSFFLHSPPFPSKRQKNLGWERRALSLSLDKIFHAPTRPNKWGGRGGNGKEERCLKHPDRVVQKVFSQTVIRLEKKGWYFWLSLLKKLHRQQTPCGARFSVARMRPSFKWKADLLFPSSGVGGGGRRAGGAQDVAAQPTTHS